MPGHRVYLQDGEQICDRLSCSYCKLLMKDPVQTSETGHRFCKECFDEAQKDPTYVGLDPNDEAWPDSIVKKEIANLQVKCANFISGCAWEGVFKDLMKHLDVCQFVTMECECGEQVLSSKLEVHLKRCPKQQVKCENCGKMSLIELQDHTELCPDAPKVCENCKKKIPASQYLHHTLNECKAVVKTTEISNPLLEVNSDQVAAYQQSIRAPVKNPMKVGSVQGETQAYRNETASTLPSRLRHGHHIVAHNPQVNGFGQQRKGALDKVTTESMTSYDNKRHSLQLEVFESQEDQQPHQFAPILPRRLAVLPSPSSMQHKAFGVERALNVLGVHYSELYQQQCQSSQVFSFDWHICEISKKIQDAKSNLVTSVDSPPFYTGSNGYKMCIRAYLNGDGTAHLSLFVVLMRGEHDSLLQWPFTSRVSLTIVDQDHKKHLVRSFTPDAQSSSFKKPDTDMNVASGCPEFANLLVLRNPSYVKDDVMHVNVKIETSLKSFILEK